MASALALVPLRSLPDLARLRAHAKGVRGLLDDLDVLVAHPEKGEGARDAGELVAVLAALGMRTLEYVAALAEVAPGKAR